MEKIGIIKSKPSAHLGEREKQLILICQALPHGQHSEKYINCPFVAAELRKKRITYKKIWLGPEPIGLSRTIIFLFLFPFLLVYGLCFLIYLRGIEKIKSAYLISLPEKILLTLPARILGVKIIWEESYIFPKWSILNPLKIIWIALSRIALILTFSKAAKEEIRKQGISERRIKVIYPGISLSDLHTQESIYGALAKNETGKKFFKIGTICHLSKNNGLEGLLQSLKIITELVPEVQLTIIGTGEERANLNWLVRKLELEKNIWFIGYQENYSYWLKSFDIFVMPVLSNQSINLSMVEAMAHFCPVIASNIKGIDEIVKHNFSGILIEPGNIEMLAQTIIMLYRDRQMLRKMSENAHQRVKAVFTIDRFMEDLNTLIK